LNPIVGVGAKASALNPAARCVRFFVSGVVQPDGVRILSGLTDPFSA
jgi:hypothetical protein